MSADTMIAIPAFIAMLGIWIVLPAMKKLRRQSKPTLAKAESRASLQGEMG